MRALLVVLLLLANPAQAHKLKLFVTTAGPEILGDAYFSGGDKAQGITAEIRTHDGGLIATLATGTDGAFRFTATARMDHVITVDGGDGHQASAVIAAADLPATLPAGSGGTAPVVAIAPVDSGAPPLDAVEAAVARQIRPLRQQLDAYEDRTRLHDILGGIGTIFGLFGILTWLSARRRSP